MASATGAHQHISDPLCRQSSDESLSLMCGG